MKTKVLTSEKTGKIPSILSNLSAREIENEIHKTALCLTNLGSYAQYSQAYISVNRILNKMVKDEFRSKFFKVFSGIDTKGIRTKQSFTLSTYDAMQHWINVWNRFLNANYNNSPLKKAVQGSLEILQSMPCNSKIQITA